MSCIANIKLLCLLQTFFYARGDSSLSGCMTLSFL